MLSITIIGAGPAGSIAAIVLARDSNWRVRLVEQHRFPRDKVCGECLSPVGIDVLRRHDLHTRISRLGPVRIKQTIFHDQSGQSARFDLPAPMWGISRSALDTALLDEARRAGATILQPARCECVSHAWVRVRDLATNDLFTLDSDVILLADGKAAFASPRPPATRDLGIRAHFEHLDAPRDAIQLFGVNRHYGGVAPIEDERFNIAFSVPAARVSACAGDLDRLFDDILGENPALRSQFRRAQRLGNWLASPLPRFGVLPSWAPGVLPIGNAAAAIEPIGGEGMGLAMRSAELAAAELIATNGRYCAARLRKRYRDLWSMRRFVCRAGAYLISSPSLAATAIELVRANERLTRAILHLSGKPFATTQTALHQTP
jgi:2-polyprenyl-6-methoxyphenol hydroxylase-like FAD-dependent oxidoreductase